MVAMMTKLPRNVPLSSGAKTLKAKNGTKISGTQKFGAIDLGTNNCRLLIVEPCQNRKNSVRVCDSFSQIVRLGQKLENSGRLCKEAQNRTIQALKVCAHKLAMHNVTSYRAVATHACREAENCDAFLERIKKETGIQMETISSAEEAVLALKGCLPLLDQKVNYALVFDIGGGSTELLWTKVQNDGFVEIIDQTSIPYGVVTLSEKFGAVESQNENFQEMIDLVTKPLVTFNKKNDIARKLNDNSVQMLGTSGTITTLAAINLGLEKYCRQTIDGATLKVSQAKDVSKKLRNCNLDERAALPCVGTERADLVVAGCAILEAICDMWPLEDISVADRGLRDGILSQLIEDSSQNPVTYKSKKDKTRQ